MSRVCWVATKSESKSFSKLSVISPPFKISGMNDIWYNNMEIFLRSDLGSFTFDVCTECLNKENWNIFGLREQ